MSNIPAKTPGLFLLLLLASLAGKAQKAPQHSTRQLTVTTENDRYMFQGKDGYYTNGILFRYNKVRQPNAESQKQINHFEAGQKLYMPYSRKIYQPSQIDRPVTGYLYAKFSRSSFPSSNVLWQWGVSADAIGKASLGQSLQNAFHDLIGVNSSWWGWVWKHQLKSQLGVNLHGTYSRGLIRSDNASRFQLVPVTKATLGTSFTYISQGLVLQVCQLRPVSQSAFWEAAVEHSPGKAKPEWAFYYYPEVLYQAYNATIRGGLLLKEKGPITSDVEPFVLTHQIGGLLRLKRYQLRASANFQSKEARTQHFSQRFGSIQFGYSF